MKIIKNYFRFSLSLLILAMSNNLSSQYTLNPPDSWNYAVEINEVLCGFSESHLTEEQLDGKTLWKLDDEIMVKLSVLGGGVDMTIDNTYYIDPKTKNTISVEHSIKTTAEVYAFSEFKNDKVYYTSKKGGTLNEMTLEDDVIIENSIVYPHLMEDFILGNEDQKSYRVYDPMRSTIATKKYKRLGEEKLELVGKTYDVIILEEFNELLGTTTKFWLDKSTSFLLKIFVQGRLIYLSDESAKKRIQVVDLDNVLFAKVDQKISDVQNISFMKVEASIVSAGEIISVDNLNTPGQRFTGTVTDNLVEGVFELEPIKYDGNNAPHYPMSNVPEDLTKYLEPENLIESDDPMLIKEAKLITKDATTSWEAVVKLSKWVAENIKGAVPGGTSAINTYNTREGECGSHSRLLAAFCRAVGIPSRLAIGCMYSPYLGGSFGQHAWTEVYMGEHGWIPIDATAFEYDYIDAGHIRLGENTSFNPNSMKILEFKMGDGEIEKPETPEEVLEYLGDYILKEANKTFTVLYSGGGLSVDIPGQTTLALNEMDENGIFYPKLTRQVNFSFLRDKKGKIDKMKLQQLIPLSRKSGLSEIPEDVPKELQPLLGNYLFSQANAEFKVFYQKATLVVYDPLSKQDILLKKTSDIDHWLDEFDKNEVRFEKNANEEITGMTIYSNNYFDKKR
jgi:hypothetical protein